MWMKVAVITPYYKTPDDWLLKCHQSVKAQTHPCTHVLVADGRPQPVADTLDAQHLSLPVNIGDYGDTPRGMGSLLAISQGFDAIAYLDADNWYSPEHIATMVALHRKSGAAVITSARNLHRLDGTLIGLCSDTDGENFVDTSCYFLTRVAFSIVPVWWMMEPWMHAVDDRVVLMQIKQAGLTRAHSSQATVAYRTAFKFHYERFGEAPPPGTKTGQEISVALERLKQMRMTMTGARRR
jgi:glycosyltransferase involved in cell wall biosynthesis